MISSVSGLIRPNDHIDIIATFRFPNQEGTDKLETVTLTLLQNVAVLAVGQDTDSAPSRSLQRQSYSSITLNVTPKEAEILGFAMQKGKLNLTLRNPSDVHVEKDIQDVDFTKLIKFINQYNNLRNKGKE